MRRIIINFITKVAKVVSKQKDLLSTGDGIIIILLYYNYYNIDFSKVKIRIIYITHADIAFRTQKQLVLLVGYIDTSKGYLIYGNLYIPLNMNRYLN